VAPQSTVKGWRKPEREQFVDRPDMVGPASGHGRRPLQPFLALLLPDAQAAVFLAEIVHAAYQVHPFLQCLLLMHQPPAAPRQTRQARPERRVQPLYVRGVYLLACPGLFQLLVDLLVAAPDHTPEHFLQTPTAALLDHLTQPHAPWQAERRSPWKPRQHLLSESPPESRWITGQPIDTDQQRLAGNPDATKHVH